MDVVELENVTKNFGDVRAVDALSLRVPEGSIYGFIGPNGSGKTTTLRMVMNILYPDEGTIRVLGRERPGEATAGIGYLPEERGLYKKMKVRDLLLFFGELKSGRRPAAAVDAWLDRLELGGWAGRKVETLSKGMAQKVQFIAAVVAKPELIILDEPFAGLDPLNLELVKNAVLGLRREGATVIFSTHDMAIAEKMCDFIFMIFQGRKVLDGTLAEIQDRFGSDAIRIRVEGGMSRLRGLPDVESAIDFGRYQELRLLPGRNPQRVLFAILSRTRLDSFEIARPTLYDIFLRVAGAGAGEAADA